MEIFVMINK